MILWQTRPSIETTSASWILFPRSTNYVSCTARVEFRYLLWLNQIAFIQEIRKTRIVSIPHRMEPLPPERSSVGRSKLAYTRRLISQHHPLERSIRDRLRKKKKKRKKGPRKRSQTIENWYSSWLKLDLDVTNRQTENGTVSIDDGEIDDCEGARVAATCANARLVHGRSLGWPPDSSLTLPTAWLADRLDGGVVRWLHGRIASRNNPFPCCSPLFVSALCFLRGQHCWMLESHSCFESTGKTFRFDPPSRTKLR